MLYDTRRDFARDGRNVEVYGCFARCSNIVYDASDTMDPKDEERSEIILMGSLDAADRLEKRAKCAWHIVPLDDSCCLDPVFGTVASSVFGSFPEGEVVGKKDGLRRR